MKIFDAALMLFTLTWISCDSNTSSNLEVKKNKEEWKKIFNGKDLSGWIPKIHRHEVGENYAETFRVNQDGVLEVNYEGYDKFEERYGHLFYEEPFSSFHLKWEYIFTDQWMEDAPHYTYRNSGIMFHSQSPESILKEQDWPISVEFQLLAEEEEGKPRPTAAICSPGTQVVYEGQLDERHCIDSGAKTYPWNQWVSAELIVFRDSLILHVVEGDTVLKYSHPQIGSSGVVNRYDPKEKVDGTPLKQGYIALQAEGQGVKFREIYIRNLEK